MPISKVPQITQVTHSNAEKKPETKSSTPNDRKIQRDGLTAIKRRSISRIPEDKKDRQRGFCASDSKTDIDNEVKWRRQSDSHLLSFQSNPPSTLMSENIPVSSLNKLLTGDSQDTTRDSCTTDFPKDKDDGNIQTESANRTFLKKPKQEIDILLIGKTGNGKSALGNSILKNKTFISKPAANSVTKEISSGSTEICERIVNVFDSPGVGDTGNCDDYDDSEPDIQQSEDDANKFIIDAMSNAIAANPQGYHAFILVLKFGDRFKIEDYKVVLFLKEIFGKHFVNKYCIIVMTFGDNFSRQCDGSFKDWLREQEKPLADVVKECNYRAVLFDNVTDDEDIREKQRVELLDLVENLVLENCRYTNDEFELAQTTRNALLYESILSHIFTDINTIVKEFEICQKNIEDGKNYENLEKLLETTNSIYEKLTNEDIDTTVCDEVINNVKSIQESIKNQLKIVSKLNEAMKREAEQKLMVAIEKIKTDKAKNESEIETKVLKTLLETERQKTCNLQNEIKQIKTKYDKSVLKKIKSKVIKSLKKNVSAKNKMTYDQLIVL